MNGQELYGIYKSAMFEQGLEVPEFGTLGEPLQQIYETMSQDINVIIDDAVVEVLPGTEAGERTDV